jgi:hypothetical protein
MTSNRWPAIALALAGAAGFLDAQELHTNRRAVDLPARLPDRPRELWVSADGGKNWLNQGPIDTGKTSAAYLAAADGRYEYAIVPIGPDGQRERTPKAGDPADGAVVVDTTPPVVELLAPNGGEIFGAKRQTIVRWTAHDPNLAPAGVVVEVSPGASADDWVVVAKDLPNTGTYNWDLMASSGQAFRVRVLVRDLAGNLGLDASDKPFTIDGLPPDLKVLGPAAANRVPVPVEVHATDLGGAGLAKLTLHVTRDGGQTWEKAVDDEDLRSPILFQDLDGAYGLRLSGHDRVGNAVAPPRPGTPPQATLLLDRTKPEVKLLAPVGGGVLGGRATEIRWSAADNVGLPEGAIALHYSDDGGKTWKEIAREIKNTGVAAWTPPAGPLGDARVRVTATDGAGNAAMDAGGRFGVDAGVPEARATGPDRSGSNAAKVHYEFVNAGSSPVAKVTLWYRVDGTKEWVAYGDDSDAVSPAIFAKADGRYGIYVTCATAQGLKDGVVQKNPESATEPQLVLAIDATPPQINLESFTGGGYFAAGSSVEVLWKLIEPNPDPRGLTVHHSPDGGTSWNLVATGLDPSAGKYRWVVPASPGARHKLRLTAVDRNGSRGETESEKTFTIDADLPAVALLEKPEPTNRTGKVFAKYKAIDTTSGIEKVVLHGRNVSVEKPVWAMLAENRSPEGSFDVAVAEGIWHFVVAAHDGAGHLSNDPARTPRPDFTVAVDLTRPQLAVQESQLPTGQKTVLNAGWEIEWTATDAVTTTDRIAIRIEKSEDAGRSWTVAVAKHGNVGKADLRSILTAGKRYRLRLVATDEAGNEAEALTPEFDPGDLPPAPLVLRGVDEGRQYVAGAPLTVAFSSPDRSVTGAVLEISPDGGRTWEAYAELSTPRIRIAVPEKAGRYHVRAAARDASGRLIRSNAIQFDSIVGVEQIRIVTHATTTPGKLVPVVFEPRTLVRTAKELRLEITSNGTDWTKLVDVRSSDVTFSAPKAPGQYAVRIVVLMPDGKEYDSNHAAIRVGGVGLQLQTFRGGETVKAGAKLFIAVKSDVDLSDVKVEFSSESGKEGTWREVRAIDLAVSRFGFFWQVPTTPSKTCRLRLSAGDLLKDESDADFAIEAGAPTGAPPTIPDGARTTPPPPVAMPGAPRLETAIPAVIGGGSKFLLSWSSPTADAKVRVLFQQGEQATLLGENLPATGTLPWTAPKADALGCAIVVESAGKQSRSAPFSIDASAPAIDAVDIELPRR